MINSVYLYQIIFVLLNFINLSKEQQFPNSPCPEIFSYIYDGNQLFGKLTVPLEGSTKQINVKVKLSYGVKLDTNYGALELAKSNEQSVNDALYSHILNYRITFPIQNSIPLLTQVLVGANVICTGPPVVSAYITTLTLENSFSIGDRFTDYYEPSEPPSEPVWSGLQSITTQERPQQITRYISQQMLSVPSFNPYKPFTSQPQRLILQQISRLAPPLPPKYTQEITQRFPNPQINHLPFVEQNAPEIEKVSISQLDQKVCGQPKVQIVDLIYNGHDTYHGEFPWLVAIYSAQKLLSYFCGGVLVTANVVLTAAHCLNEEDHVTKRMPETMLVYLGGYNIKTRQDQQSIIANVNHTYIHEEYDPRSKSADADLGFIKLQISVKYNDYIRPVCLWSGANNIEDIIGMYGTVVGWGKDESNELATTPKKISVPIVSGEECVRSNYGFTSATSSRTFCAGAKNNDAPCPGDSGSGLYIYRNSRWELRGLVSRTVSDPITECNLKDFVVYTDVTKYPIIPFIKYVINK